MSFAGSSGWRTEKSDERVGDTPSAIDSCLFRPAFKH